MTVARSVFKEFEQINHGLAARDALLALGGYGGMLVLAVLLARVHVMLALPFAVLAGMFLVKVFTIQHDCGHGTFVRWPWLRQLLGRVCSVLTLVPFKAWAMEHNVHHAQFANVDKDQMGEVWLMTEAEYAASPAWRRVAYRAYRHPAFLLGVAPLLLFVVRYRWTALKRKEAWVSALVTDVVLVGMYGGFFMWASGAQVVAVVVAWYVASVLAIGLFYVQHAFEGACYFDGKAWSFEKACVANCSQLVLPKWMDFFSGNISYHHLHHFSSKIPCYNLPAAQAKLGAQVPAKQLRLQDIPAAFMLGLWSEERGALVGF